MDLQKENTLFLKQTREEIIQSFESLDNSQPFKRTLWNYQNGKGGGEMAILRGKIFEKAAVNFSQISGDRFPMSDAEGSFFATGVSLITHMHNPHAPTVHMNIRYIETNEKKWVAGGYDLTPMGFLYQEDKEHFHQVAKETLAPFGEDLYRTFSKNAEDYFYIPHRKKQRGVGGIFFDHFWTDDLSYNLNLWKAIGTNFLKAILPIYERRMDQPFTQEEKEKQLEYRAHYAEFNLIYDKGTKFGFLSGGNTEAILCSMPPLAKW